MLEQGSGGVTVVRGDIPAGMPHWKFWIVQLGRLSASKNPETFKKMNAWSLSALCQMWMYSAYLHEVGAEVLPRKTYLELADYLELNWQFISPPLQRAIPFRALYSPSAEMDWVGNPIAHAVQEGCQDYLASLEEADFIKQNAKDYNESLRREASA